MARLFAGPTVDPDRYELVELLSTDDDGVERWYATRWHGNQHIPHHLAVKRDVDRAGLSIVGIGPSIAAPTPVTDDEPWDLTESFAGPLPHAWHGANASTLAWYQVWARVVDPTPTPVAAIRPPAPPPAPPAPVAAAPARSNRKRVIVIIAACALSILATVIGVLATDDADDGSAGATQDNGAVATTVRAPEATTAPPRSSTTTSTIAATTTAVPVPHALDAIGDSFGADLVSVTALTDGRQLAFDIRFSDASFSADSRVTIGVDVDRNPETGHRGNGSLCDDVAVVGAEVILGIDGNSETVDIGNYAGSCNQFNSTRGGRVEQVANGYLVTIPLTDIRSNNGIVNYDLTSSTSLGPGVSTPIQDYLPDLGGGPLTSV